MAIPSDYTDEQIAEAIENCAGYMLAIAKQLDCRPLSIRSRIYSTPHLRDLLIECEEAVSDNAELYLIEAIEGRSPWAIKYWLTHKAKNRGYGQKLEIQASSSSGGGVVVYLPDDGRESKPDGDGDSTASGSTGCSTPQ
jgi:hypothetical protein